METTPLTEAKAHLSELVERVASQHDRVTITRNGRPAAVLVSPDDLEGLEETLALLADPKAVTDIRRSLHEARAGKNTPWADVKRDLERRRGGR